MAKFSANLGFLWHELPLPDAIRSAGKAGFDAVECHWPYATPVEEVTAALTETGLKMISLNTSRGTEPSDFGMSALPGRTGQARTAIDRAIEYATGIGTPNIHVMAGNAEGTEAHDTFVANLRYAAQKAAPAGITVLIEPLNSRDAPGYFLKTTGQAKEIIEEIAAPNLKLMFDCYHVQITEGDITTRLGKLLPIIGHVQIASVPARAEPDNGELDYGYVIRALTELGYRSPIGAEYRPASGAVNNLGWIDRFRQL